MSRVVVLSGSRSIKDEAWVSKHLGYHLRHDHTFRHGGCKEGVDEIVDRLIKRQMASEHGYEITLEVDEVTPEEWRRYGRAAGPRRNERMIKTADKVVCFWDGRSPGTLNAAHFALQYGCELTVYNYYSRNLIQEKLI